MSNSMAGKHYGMLRTMRCIGYVRNKYTQQIWECKCECGRTCVKTDAELKRGSFKHPHEYLNCGADIHRREVRVW